MKNDENSSTSSDWRLGGQERFLQGVKLYWMQYTRCSEDWDHDHCSFCWAKFTVEDYPDALHEGYSTSDKYHWVCKKCFDDFKEQFRWEVGSDGDDKSEVSS